MTGHGALAKKADIAEFNAMLKTARERARQCCCGWVNPFLRNAQAVRRPAHYLMVSADESEPGTCKDREIMRHDAHLLIEVQCG